MPALQPMPRGSGLTVVVNEAAGGAAQAQAWLQRALPSARLVAVKPSTGVSAAFDDQARLIAAEGGQALGVLGGDGSVNAAAGAALQAGIPLAVFPGGTLNHFASAAGLYTVADTAAAVERGEGEAVDVGLMNEPGADRPPRVFVNTFVLGVYADMVFLRDLLGRRCDRRIATALALSLACGAARSFRVWLEGEHRRLWLLFVGNGIYRSHWRWESPARAGLSSGRLDVRLLDANGWRMHGRLAATLAHAADAPENWPLPERRLVTGLDLDDLTGLRYACDGETADAPASLRLEVAHAVLPVYRPSRKM
ncbi:diacylglycerol kinase family protein [Streptomyces sp. NPDC004680]|uniref:diacylglycerol/lipid kinase family protein n=1 Tax=Streptomyces sp. NPDC004680 TaxID=3154287 RepID=UPI0033B62B81